MAFGGTPVKPSSVPYFYGRITRDEAEEILKERKSVDGMFLLRESISPLGNYAVSLCYQSRMHHYVIEKQSDGTYRIPSGKRFPGPIELIDHHMINKDGVVTLLTRGCDRQPDQQPVAFRGMTYNDLEGELIQKANSIKGVNKERALGAQRDHLVVMVAKDLHTKQPWYHGKIVRNEAEKRLREDGHKDGKFLVRMREDKKSFAVCISYRSETKHYLIGRDTENKFAIQDGPKFECIMMLIDHYHNKQDGLMCKLSVPCPSPGFDPVQLDRYLRCNMGNLEYFSIRQVQNGIGSASARPPRPSTLLPATPPPVPSLDKRPSLKERLSLKGRLQQKKNTRRKLPPTPDEAQQHMLRSGDWEGDVFHRQDYSKKVSAVGMDPERLEDIYGRVPRTLHDFNLRRDQIDLQETLGAGQFGSVCKGICTLKDGKSIPVAVKTLKKEECHPNQEPELIKEAKIMMPLSHKHIVRMIGLCKAESIMLVIEIAPLGPLNSFLQNHKDTTQANIVELLWQVAMGMEYLESKRFVHRDLAARNVLLVSQHFAKISDFGMSKAVGRENNYYEAREAGKWPLKWYAPECVYYWKFDSKSDVWSYGVTMWEALSFGERPYKKMKGQEILQFLVEENKRLDKPEICDESVYDIMLQCWEYDKNDRPTFKELAELLKEIYYAMRHSNYR